MKLTKRQKQILDFLSEFIEINGYSPSMEEIAAHFHFASLNAVFKHLEALERRGFLHRDSNRARSIQLSPEAKAVCRVFRSSVLLPQAGRSKPFLRRKRFKSRIFSFREKVNISCFEFRETR